MRTSTTTALLIIACTVSAYLFWELREAKRAAAPTLGDARQEGQRDIEVPPSPAALHSDAGESDTASSSQIADVFSADQRIAGGARVELLKDPEYRKARLAQIRANLTRRFPGVAHALGLSEYEAEQLLNLLAEQQLDSNAALNALRAKGLDADVERDERDRILEESGRERERAVRELLGSSGFDQWRSYEDSLPRRADAEQMLTSALAVNSQSVSGTNLGPVVTAAAMEQTRYEMEMQSLLQSARERGPQGMANVQGELLNLREASNRRILDAARPYLGPDQLAALGRKFDQEASAARDRLRVHQERERQ